MPHSSSTPVRSWCSAAAVDHLVEQRGRLLERRALGRDVAVVEAVEGHAELREELERGVHLLAGGGDRVGARRERRVPRTIERAGPEDVEPVPREAVPVTDREPQVVLHPTARDDTVGVVPAKRQRVVAVGPLEGDRCVDVGEEWFAHPSIIPQPRGLVVSGGSSWSDTALVIEVRGLTKRFGKIVAVDDLSFDVVPGRVTGFLGPNGSGKSTTMRCMLGLDRYERGSATFDGKQYARARQAAARGRQPARRRLRAPRPDGAEPPALARRVERDPARARRGGPAARRAHRRRQAAGQGVLARDAATARPGRA